MSTDPRSRQPRRSPRASRILGWISAVSGLLASVVLLLLLFTGQTEAIVPVAILGAAVAGGTAVTVNIRIQR